jgi:hypothetical protein
MESWQNTGMSCSRLIRMIREPAGMDIFKIPANMFPCNHVYMFTKAATDGEDRLSVSRYLFNVCPMIVSDDTV